MNKIIEELYDKIDAQDKIINEQALEIARLNKRNQEIYDGFMVAIDEVCETDREKREYKQKIDKAIEYINKNKQIVSNLKCSAGCSPNEEPKEYNVYKLYCEPTELLEILGDKENE